MIKKLIYILILIIISTNIVLAETQGGYLDYNIYDYEFKPGDNLKFSKKADENMRLWEKSTTDTDRKFYLQEAMRYYFLLSQLDVKNIDAHIGLGRIYDEMKQDRYAKEHFFLAYNMDNSNPKLNYYFADFYYKRNDLITAINHYKRAYKYGYSNNSNLNYKLGIVYEKLADIETSKKFYKNVLKLNSKTPELGNKIRLLDELNYSGSQYYLYGK